MIVKFPIDKTDPMNGIFHYFVAKNLTKLISASQKIKHRLEAIDLIYHNPSTWFAAECKDNAYMEFNISLFKVYLTGYGIMNYDDDDNAPRNWRITCIDEREERELTKEESNQELCPGIAPFAKCGGTFKKAFIMSHPMYCNKIRYYGGIDSSNQYYIQMSGFELFGKISLGKESKCYCNQYRRSSACLLLILITVSY